MSFLDRFRGKKSTLVEPILTPVNRNREDDFAYQFLMKKISEISSETASEYSRKATLKRFIEGDQWSTNARNSRVQPATDNICAPVVEKYVSFFTRTIPKDKIPTKPSFKTLAQSSTPEIDEEEVTKGYEEEQQENDLRLELLRVVKYEDNDYDKEIISSAFNSIGLGDAFMRVVGDEKTKKIKITSLNPFNTRIFWKSDDFTEVDGYCHVSMRSVHSIFENYGLIVGEEEYDLPVEAKKTYVSMARFYDAWFNGKEGDKYYLWNISIVGGHVIRNKKYYFKKEIKAVVHLPAIRRTSEPFGKSLIEEIVDPKLDPDNSLQMQRNKIYSDMLDLVRYAPNNIFLGIGTNLGEKEFPTGTQPYLIEVGRDQKIEALNLAKPMIDFQRLLSDNLRTIDDKTGMPRAAFGDLSSIDLATGIGLTTAFESATAKLQLVSRNWKTALQDLNRYIFMWAERLFPESKSLINGKYDTEVKFGKMQPRDLALYSTVIINQKGASLISTETAMSELDIVDSPRQEMVKIANEQNNQWLNPELALQKIQTRLQAESIEAQAKEKVVQPNPGARPSVGPEAPTATPEQNQYGVPQPMSQKGEVGGGGPNQIVTPNKITGKQ